MHVVLVALTALFILVVPVVERAYGQLSRASLRAYAPRAFLGGLSLYVFLAYVLAQRGAVEAVIGGVVVIAGMTAATVVHFRRFGRYVELASSLVRGDASSAAAIDGLVGRWWRASRASKAPAGNDTASVKWTLHFVQHALLAGRIPEASRWLAAIEPDALTPMLRAVAAQYGATIAIRQGDLKAARTALARAPRPAASPAFEESLAAVEALIDVLDGADVEERAARALKAQLSDAGRAQWQVVRAHDLARKGENEAAAELLRELRASSGEEPLLRIISHRGPASATATKVLGEDGAYR